MPVYLAGHRESPSVPIPGPGRRRGHQGSLALADDKPTAPSLPRDGFLPDELRAMEATAAAFMKKHQVPGLSVAIARKGRLVYADGYGLADKDRDEKVTPNHLFRIASVTKPITSATIFTTKMARTPTG